MSLKKDNYLAGNLQGSKSSSPPPSSPPPSSPLPSSPPPSSPLQGQTSEEKKAPPDEIERAKKKLSREINRIDIWTSNLVDNGLFDKQKKAFEKKRLDPERTFEDIQQYLKEARTKLHNDD